MVKRLYLQLITLEMTDLDSKVTHVWKAQNAVMRSVLSILLAIVALTGWAQEGKQDTIKVKKERKIYLYGYLSDSFTRSHIPD